MIEANQISYQLVGLTADGRRLQLAEAIKELEWEEQPEELAVRLTATLQNTELGGQWLHELLPLNAKLFLYVDMGSGQQEIFRGSILRTQYQVDPLPQFVLTAYDPLIYLAKSTDDRFYAAGTTARTIITDIAKAWEIPLGTIEGPDVALSKQVFRSERLSQMIDSVLKEAKKRGSGKYIARANLNTIDIVKQGGNSPVYVFYEDNISFAEDSQSIENLVTRVKILGAADDNERRPVEAQVDGRTEFGIFQEILSGSEYDTPAAAKEAAQDILDERGKPEKTRKIETIDIPVLRRGDRVRIEAGTLNGYYVVSGVSHNASKRAMTMEVEELE